MRVLIPTLLHSYTGGLSEVDCAGATLGDVLAELDARFPGLRFRVVDEQDRLRRHMKFFVGGALAKSLAQPIAAGQEVMIVGALSGG